MSSRFTPVYETAREVITGQKFAEPEWHKFLTETCGASKLLGPGGFDPAYSSALDSIRTKIKSESKHTNAVAVALLGGGPGEVIYKAGVAEQGIGRLMAGACGDPEDALPPYIARARPAARTSGSSARVQPRRSRVSAASSAEAWATTR